MREIYKYNDFIENIIKTMQNESDITEASKIFHKSRILKFFNVYMSKVENCDKPINAITYFDINTFLDELECSDSQKVNIYSSLKTFFEYTYKKGITNEIMSRVERPQYIRGEKEILTDEQYDALKEYIVDRNNSIEERMILGLFLFTGLSRQYIASIKVDHFVFEDGVYKLKVDKGKCKVKKVVLPLKAELQLIISEYLMTLDENDSTKEVVRIGENYISSYVKKLVNKIIGVDITPTILSSTFISKCLEDGSYVYEVSKLTLESTKTIEQHINIEDNLFKKQTKILNSF